MPARRKAVRPILFILLLAGFALHPAAADSPAQVYLQRVKQEIILRQADAAVAAVDEVTHAIDRFAQAPKSENIESARRAFAGLVRHWKAVEAVYIAGALDEEYIDHPRYIDQFHQGNEPVGEVVENLLQSNADLEKAMFKFSSKGINALEYLLFAASGPEPRRTRAMQIALAHIGGWLTEIRDFYYDENRLVSGETDTLALLVNALVDSSYRLANWRTGEPGGLVDRYRGRPDPRRLEYYYSGLSVDAIVAILETHRDIFELGIETGYFAARKRGLEEIELARKLIREALASARALQGSAEVDVASPAFVDLYHRSEALYRAYYFLLVDKLELKPKIVDGDGD